MILCMHSKLLILAVRYIRAGCFTDRRNWDPLWSPERGKAAPGLWPKLESLWLLAFPHVSQDSRGIGSQSTAAAAAARDSMREAIF